MFLIFALQQPSFGGRPAVSYNHAPSVLYNMSLVDEGSNYLSITGVIVEGINCEIVNDCLVEFRKF